MEHTAVFESEQVQSALEMWTKATYPDNPEAHQTIIAFVRLSQLFVVPLVALNKENIAQTREYVMRVLDGLHTLEASFHDGPS